MKLLTPIIILFSLLASPAYTFAATLSFSPSSGTFNKGCPLSVQIKLDTGQDQTDGTDAIILYDQSKLTANTSSVTTGSIYSDYPGTNVDDTAGKITVSGLASVSSAYSSQGTPGVFATINFTVKENTSTGATMVTFDFDSKDRTKTTDSNVVQRGTVADVLSSVTNGNYTIGTGSCAAATPSPVPKGGQGAVVVVPSTPSAQIPVKEIPVKTLPPAGSEQFTFTIAIIGSALTVLGILGLALL